MSNHDLNIDLMSHNIPFTTLHISILDDLQCVHFNTYKYDVVSVSGDTTVELSCINLIYYYYSVYKLL